MQVLAVIFMVIIALGLTALITYQVISLVKAIKMRKKQKLEDDKTSRKEIN